MRHHTCFATLLCFLLLWIPDKNLHANNLSISNVQFVTQAISPGYAILGFDISWENSWRDSTNWDAAWVFVKYRLTPGSGPWLHATMNHVDGTTDGHVAGTGGTIRTPSDGKGVFLFADADFTGAANYIGNSLRWDFAADGLSTANGTEICIFAIEMVHVAQGAFWLGDGASGGSQYGNFEDGVTGNPFQVTSEAAITLGGGAAGSLGNNDRENMANNGLFSIPGPSIDDFDDATSQQLPAAFPKGFTGFYCMKYEMTQGQYVDFLNHIDPTQWATRYDSANYTTSHGGFNTTRYHITGGPGTMTTVAPDVPATYVEWYDALAYADWAGLRPMTELEFEKACRGPLTPVDGEYAWGDATVNSTTYFPITNQNAPNEGIGAGYSTTEGNAWYADTRGMNAPVRVGIFAADPANSGRRSSGASYWGIMGLSGNCWERVVTVGRPEGRAFTGAHGDGILLPNGNADVPGWPGNSGNGVETAVDGGGYRGGAFDFPSPTVDNMRISSRRMATAFYNIRYFDDTARFVRTAE